MTATPTPIRRVSMGATSCHESLSGSYLHGRRTQSVELKHRALHKYSLPWTFSQVVVLRPGVEVNSIGIARHDFYTSIEEYFHVEHCTSNPWYKKKKWKEYAKACLEKGVHQKPVKMGLVKESTKTPKVILNTIKCGKVQGGEYLCMSIYFHTLCHWNNDTSCLAGMNVHHCDSQNGGTFSS